MSASDIAAWADRVAAGDRRALARALTEVENRGPAAPALLAALRDRRKPTLTAGVTGAPGVGKSTLVDILAERFAASGDRVAVLAVDPSSPFTGGALLGDRVRMSGRDEDARVYIRSMAARGALGGLAAAVEDALAVLSAAGFDAVLIETVGVGQAEVDVARLASPVVLVVTPGLGDGVQALKAGVMEIADVFVINKADIPGADRAENEIRAALEIRAPADGPPPAVLRTVASTGEGLSALVDAIDSWAPRALGARPPSAPAPRIDHIGVAVDSIDQALELWSNALGVRPGERIRVEHEGVEVAILPFGESRVELLEAEPGSAVARFLEKRGEGLHHIALRVADFEAVVAALRERGARLLSDEPGVGAEGYRYVFLHPESANGVLLELIADD